MAYYAAGGQQPQQQGYYQHHAPPPHNPHQQQMPPHFQQQQQQQQTYGPRGGHPSYGNYGDYYKESVFSVQAWQAYHFQNQDEMYHIFHAEMHKNQANIEHNAIQREDLYRIMNECQSIQQFFRISWSMELCSIMLAMLDRSRDGFMQWEEFLELQQCLVAWHNIFKQYDTDRSGFIEAHELTNVIKNLFRYNLTPDSLTTIFKRYSKVVGGRLLIAFDDFVAMSVRLRAYTDAFRKRDKLANGRETGNCGFQYDDFIRCVLCL